MQHFTVSPRTRNAYYAGGPHQQALLALLRRGARGPRPRARPPAGPPGPGGGGQTQTLGFDGVFRAEQTFGRLWILTGVFGRYRLRAEDLVREAQRGGQKLDLDPGLGPEPSGIIIISYVKQ